jgi:PAS domain S-box-containing protein
MRKATPIFVADEGALPYVLALDRRRRRVLRRKIPSRRLFHKNAYLRVFHAAPNPYQLLSPDLVIVDANPAYCTMTGVRREDIIGRKAFQVFPEKTTPAEGEGMRKITASFRTVLATGRPDCMTRLRYDLRRADGSYEERYWMIENIPVLDDAGRVIFIINHPEDVTSVVKMFEVDANAANAKGIDDEIEGLHQQLAALHGLIETVTTPSVRATLTQLTVEIENQCERLIGRGMKVKM